MTDAVVVGAGIAGLGAAYHLTRLGLRDVVVIEREDVPAAHASGRNAAIFQCLAPEPANVTLAVASRDHLLGTDWGASIVRETGVLTVAEEREAPALAESIRVTRQAGVDVTELSPPEAEELAPLLAHGRIRAAVLVRRDGVIDINALVQGLLAAARAAGARLVTACRVERILTSQVRVLGVETSTAGEIAAPLVVNAAGAWAGDLGAAAGGARLPLRPLRRHLLHLEPSTAVDQSGPVVWDSSAPLYYRPESGGLLASPCDEEEAQPGPAVTRPDIAELFAGICLRAAPRLAEARVRRPWACLRTMTPDRRFVVGEDPQIRGLVWIAGLGGHGMSAGLEAGRLAAEIVAGRTPPAAQPLDPRRFL